MYWSSTSSHKRDDHKLQKLLTNHFCATIVWSSMRRTWTIGLRIQRYERYGHHQIHGVGGNTQHSTGSNYHIRMNCAGLSTTKAGSESCPYYSRRKSDWLSRWTNTKNSGPHNFQDNVEQHNQHDKSTLHLCWCKRIYLCTPSISTSTCTCQLIWSPKNSLIFMTYKHNQRMDMSILKLDAECMDYHNLAC